MAKRKYSKTMEDGVLTLNTFLRTGNEVPKDEAVECWLSIDYSGVRDDDKKFLKALTSDPTVDWANVARPYFDDQDHLREWAEENATKDNPHFVQFEGIGSKQQFVTQEEKARLARKAMKAQGLDPENDEDRRKFLGL